MAATYGDVAELANNDATEALGRMQRGAGLLSEQTQGQSESRNILDYPDRKNSAEDMRRNVADIYGASLTYGSANERAYRNEHRGNLERARWGQALDTLDRNWAAVSRE